MVGRVVWLWGQDVAAATNAAVSGEDAHLATAAAAAYCRVFVCVCVGLLGWW